MEETYMPYEYDLSHTDTDQLHSSTLAMSGKREFIVINVILEIKDCTRRKEYNNLN